MAGLRIRHEPATWPDARSAVAGADHSSNKQIVVITDGEPTAHFEDGQVEFSYPPTRRTIVETLREVARCTREGITINTFMLERSRALAEFVDRLTRLNSGRAFYASPEALGEYVLVDYVDRKRKRGCHWTYPSQRPGCRRNQRAVASLDLAQL